MPKAAAIIDYFSMQIVTKNTKKVISTIKKTTIGIKKK